jgi:hypothetical protein
LPHNFRERYFDSPIAQYFISQNPPNEAILEAAEGNSNNNIDESLIKMQVVINKLLDAVKNRSNEFRNTVAPSTGAISLLLHAEYEDYGMTKDLNTNLMKNSRKHSQKLKVIMDVGNFGFEGTNSDTNKQIVLNIGDGNKVVKSHIPPGFLPEEVVIEVVGQKRKANFRGPGRESFKSARACLAYYSQQLSNPIIEIIETQYQNCSVNKKSELIISALKVIMKKYQIKPEEFGTTDATNSDRIVFSLSSYLKNLQKFGAKLGSTEGTIEKLLPGAAVYNINDSEMSKVMGVSRRRIKNAKNKRGVFDDIVKKEERNNEDNYSDSSGPSDADISDAESEKF